MSLALVRKCYPLEVAIHARGGLKRVPGVMREESTIPKCSLVPQSGGRNNVESYAAT